MAVSIQEINQLRSQTGAGLTDCKNALSESGGDFEKAIEYLRKKGQKIASARSDRESKEGVVLASVDQQKKTGYLICVACETDFVAKNENFIQFAQSLLDLAQMHNANTIDEVLALSMQDGTSVSQKIEEQVGKIGEKIYISSYHHMTSYDGVGAYIHGANRIGVLVGLNQSSQVALNAGRNLAMQIAAMKPLAVDESSIDTDLVAKEKSLIKQLLAEDPKMKGKPEQMLEKIAEGKLGAFMKESTLLAQPYVKDGNMSVATYLNSVDSQLAVLSFQRVAVGS